MNQSETVDPRENHTSIQYRVLYADTDRMGVVYHGEYFRWFEAGRANYMRRRGVPYSAIESKGVLLPVVEANANYIRPARYDDVVSITTWLAELGRVQLTFAYEISNGNTTIARGLTRHAAIDETARPVRIQPFICEALRSEEIRIGDVFTPAREE